MFNIDFNPEEGSYSSYQLNSFTEEVEAKRKKEKEKEFVQDGGKVRDEARDQEFVLGGFEFEYGGGYRRDEIQKKTTDEIDKMISDAKKRAEEIENQAREKGYKDGHEKGQKEGFKEITSLMESLSDAITSLMNTRQELFQQSEKEMINLVSLVAAEIVYREIKQDEKIIADVLRNALKEVHSKQKVVIRLNPSDMEVARNFGKELIEKIDSVEGIKLKSDSAITEGGCIVETNIGSLDATVETRLRAVHEKISEKLNG